MIFGCILTKVSGITATTYSHNTVAQTNPLCFDGVDLWMALDFLGTLSILRESPSDGSIVATYNRAVPSNNNYRPKCVVDADGNIWFGSGTNAVTSPAAKNVLYKIDSITGALLGTFDITSSIDIANSGVQCVGMSTDGVSIFALCQYINTLAVSVSTLTSFASDGSINWSVILPFARVAGPVFEANNLWTANWSDNTVTSYDTVAGALNHTVNLGSAVPVSITSTGGDLWIADGANNTTIKITSLGIVVDTFALGSTNNFFPYLIQSDNSGNLWFITQNIDVSQDYTILVLDDSGTQIASYVFTGSGLDPDFAIINTLAYDGERMFGTMVTVDGDIALLAMLLEDIPPAPPILPIRIHPPGLPFLQLPWCQAWDDCQIYV